MIQVVEVKVAVTEADAGEHGVAVLAVGAVGGDVEEGRSVEPLVLRTSVEAWSPRKSSAPGSIEATDRTSSRIWGARSSGMPRTKRGRQIAGGFCLAKGEDRGTGRVGNGVRVTEIGVAGRFQCMERKEVQGAVGDEDQVFGIAEVRAKWCD